MREGESRDYIFNLRRGWLKSPNWKRSKKAIIILQELIARHSKIETVRLGRWLNEHIWKHGGKNPPAKVKVNIKAVKEKDEKSKKEWLVAKAELVELPPRAARIAKLEEEQKKKAEAKQKGKEEEKPAEKAAEAAEKTPKAQAKKQARKESRKDLQKELREAKESEEKKKLAKLTATEERKLHH